MKKFGGLLTKSDGLHCPRCGREEVYHNGETIICIPCDKELRKKYKGKELATKLKKLTIILDKAERLKYECYNL